MEPSDHPTEPVAAWATDCRDKYAENHDSGYAGRICMADGNLAWAAVIADGCGGSMEGLKVSALAIQAFVEAVRTSTLAELADPGSREAWMRAWTKALHTDAFSRFKGGMSTLCGAVLLPPGASDGRMVTWSDGRMVGSSDHQTIRSSDHQTIRPSDHQTIRPSDHQTIRPSDHQTIRPSDHWTLFTLNVGDSQVLRLTGDGKCMGITPDAPPNNANVEGHNPIRVVGVAPKADFALLDVEEFPLPAEGPCWILAGSDGFFSKKRGKDEICIFSSGDLRDVCMAGAPFHELPALAIKRSLANAQKLDCAEMMDNATVAMLGFRVSPTDLSAAPGSGGGLPAALASAAQSAAPAPAGRPDAASGGRRAAQAAQTRPKSARSKSAGAGGAGRRGNLPLRAALLVVALLLGLVIGRLSASSRHAPDSSPPPPPAPKVQIDPDMLPKAAANGKRGRCAECWKRYKAGEITDITKTYHFADEWDECTSRRPK